MQRALASETTVNTSPSIMHVVRRTINCEQISPGAFDDAAQDEAQVLIKHGADLANTILVRLDTWRPDVKCRTHDGEHMAYEHVVILLPGISGSVLSRDGKDCWGTGAGALARAIGTFGTSFKELELPPDALTNENFDDGFVASDLVQDLHILPGLWKIDGYTKAANYMIKELGLLRGKNFIEFPYDWRLDNRRAAKRLAEAVPAILRKWRASSNNQNAKLVLVGHSMGGLVARYYLECHEGWKDTIALMTFGTPFRGSLNALGFLANGFSKGIGPLKVDLSSVLGSMDSVYQLLPTFDCVKTDKDALQKLTEVSGITGLDEQRVRNAAAFHEEIATAYKRNLTVEGYADSYRIYPVVGSFQPTWQSATLADHAITLLRTRNGLDAGGDGTVPRPSALPPEQKLQAMAMFSENLHGSLQNVTAILEQFHGVLTGLKPGDYRAPSIDMERSLATSARPAIMLADVYTADTPNGLTVEPSMIDDEKRIPGDLAGVTAKIFNVETGKKADDVDFRRDVKGVHRGSFTVPAGAYRIQITAEDSSAVVTDTFLVIEE